MAALDFGMALTRGLIPTLEGAQKDLINRAGGRNVFKSEDWWNAEVNKQLQEGYNKQEKAFEYLTTSGEYKPGERFEVSTTSGMDMLHNPFLTGEIMPRRGETGSRYIGYKPPKDAVSQITPYSSSVIQYQQQLNRKYPGQGVGTAYVSEQYPAGKPTGSPEKSMVGRTFAMRETTGTRQDFFTANELKQITAGAKSSVQQTQREAAEKKATTRRASRGAAGLIGQTRPIQEPLGATGLRTEGSTLGAIFKL